jgi:hypothetical protein
MDDDMLSSDRLELEIIRLKAAQSEWLTKFVKCYDYVRAGWNYTELHHLLDEARARLKTP